MKSGPSYEYEIAIGGVVAGVDEVGRGPLAGPVTAAALILDPGAIPNGLNDSKVLSARQRDVLHDALSCVAIYAIGLALIHI